MVAQRLVIFLDDADTMNDARLRDEQVRQAVGAFLPRLLGGTRQAWANAHAIALAELWDGYRRTMFGNVEADYPSFRRCWLVTWLRRMCELVGIPAPDEDACHALALRTEHYATREVRAAFPGAIEAIRLLHTWGYTLHTASSADSAELEGYLEGMEVRQCFGRLYGPDLVNTIKEGPLYYTRIFADAGVEPAHALVVDDNPLVTGWAAAAGAWTARIGIPRGDWPEPHLQLTSLADLPDALPRLENMVKEAL